MGKSWPSYFWCGGVAVFLSWALSGCYIGNKEVAAPFNGPWFYETQLANIQVCATANGQPANCKNTVLNQYLPQFYIPLVPGLDFNFASLSNPVMLTQLPANDVSIVGANYGIYDLDSGSIAFIANANGSATSPISYVASTQVEVFHDVNNGNNPTCIMDTSVHIAGNLTNTGPYDTYSSNSLSGRMVFDVTITMTPDPVINTDCKQAIRCYNDPVDPNSNPCKGVSVNEVAGIFQDFQILGAVDFRTEPTINSLSYTIQYQ